MTKIVSAISGLTNIEAGIKGSFLFKVLAKSDNNQLFFLRLTVYPQASAFMPTQYVGKQNPKHDAEFDETVSLMCEMLKRRKNVATKDVEEQVAALLMRLGATSDEILEAIPDSTLSEIYERLRKALSAYHTDLLFTRPNNRRKKVYTEAGFGQIYIDHIGGISDFGESEMQAEINKFKANYTGKLRVKLI